MVRAFPCARKDSNWTESERSGMCISLGFTPHPLKMRCKRHVVIHVNRVCTGLRSLQLGIYLGGPSPSFLVLRTYDERPQEKPTGQSQVASRHQCTLILSLCQVRAGKLATLASRSHRPLSQCQCIEECNLGSVIANDLSSVTCLQCHLTIINGSPSEPARRSLDAYAAAAPSSGAAKGPAGPTRVCIGVVSFPTAKERNQSQWLNVFAVAWRG